MISHIVVLFIYIYICIIIFQPEALGFEAPLCFPKLLRVLQGQGQLYKALQVQALARNDGKWWEMDGKFDGKKMEQRKNAWKNRVWKTDRKNTSWWIRRINQGFENGQRVETKSLSGCEVRKTVRIRNVHNSKGYFVGLPYLGEITVYIYMYTVTLNQPNDTSVSCHPRSLVVQPLFQQVLQIGRHPLLTTKLRFHFSTKSRRSQFLEVSTPKICGLTTPSTTFPSPTLTLATSSFSGVSSCQWSPLGSKFLMYQPREQLWALKGLASTFNPRKFGNPTTPPCIWEVAQLICLFQLVTHVSGCIKAYQFAYEIHNSKL